MKAVLRSAGILGLALLAGCATTTARPPTGEAVADFESDRRAILGMTGEFEVTFDFQETVALERGYSLAKPQHSAGWERIEVALDEGSRIVLRHVLVTKDGHVQKHWTQDWRYEDTLLYEFRGDRTFVPRRLTPAQAAGTWTQAVYEVDESPRYESFGRWVHRGAISTWTSADTWRPLPRREHTKRKDYGVLLGVNRQEIVPVGWVHQQDNVKLVVGEGSAPRPRVRESGVNRYLPTKAVSFAPAREYAQATAAYWDLVRRRWDARLDGTRVLRLKRADGDLAGFEEAFTLAGEARGKDAAAAAGLELRVEEMIDRDVETLEPRSP